nr:hypothetical protein [Orientia tsutsugamushi]
MPEIKLNLRPNLLRLFRYLSAIILNYLNQFRKRPNIFFHVGLFLVYLNFFYNSTFFSLYTFYSLHFMFSLILIWRL